MKPKILLFGIWFLILLGSMGFSHAQDNTSLQNLTNTSMPAHYEFEGSSIWAEIKVHVIDQNDSFIMKIESDTPVDGWVVRAGMPATVIQRGRVNSKFLFSTKVPSVFSGSFVMTAFVEREGDLVPVDVNISAGNGNAQELKAGDLEEGFSDDKDRPYYYLVKGFFDQAVDYYRTGDYNSALEQLSEARKLDPDQPQVQALIERIRLDYDTTVNAKSLQEAEQLWHDGNIDIALEKINLILDNSPWYEPALKMRAQIEAALTEEQRKVKIQSLLQEAQKASIDGEVPDAVDLYHHVLVLDPDNVSANTALKGLQKKIDLSPSEKTHEIDLGSTPEAQAAEAYNLGLESYSKEDYAAAYGYWKQALKIDPSYIHAKQAIDRLLGEHSELSSGNQQ